VNLIRPLYAAAAALAVTGLALHLVPVGQPRLPASSRSQHHGEDGGRTLPVQTAAGILDSAATDPIVTADIFARARTAPGRAGAAVAPKARGAPVVHAPAFTLYGTTIGPSGAVALIDAGSGGVHMYHAGETVAGAQVEDITDSTVTLARASGSLILHLPRTRQTP
jgi:hypothetical protein